MKDKERYISLSLSQLVPEQPLPADLYLFLNGHFIKYKTEGDVLPGAKYNEFFNKKLDFVFCLVGKVEAFDQWYLRHQVKSKEEMIQNVGIKNKDLVDQRESIKTDLFRIFSGEITDEKCRELQDKTRKFIEVLSSRKSSQSCLNKLINYNPSVAEHSVNVATLSVYLCYNLGYNHQLILENVYMGALLHDFGKTMIDPKLLETASESEYQRVMRSHVELGRDSISQFKSLPLEVVKIVAEHHEHCDGSGYPKKLRGTRIYELAKIVSIANVFDNYASSAVGSIKERQKQALSLLKADTSERFDSKKLEKCLDVLRHGL